MGNIEPNLFNNSQCMAQLNNSRCKHKPIKNQDFCAIHINSNYDNQTLTQIKKQDLKMLNINSKKLQTSLSQILINNKIANIIILIKSRMNNLDKHQNYNLMFLQDSWNEVALYRQINVFNSIWDIDFIIKHYTQQLNSSLMDNSYPMYPSNPLNRELAPVHEIINIKSRIKKLNRPVNIALKIFLNIDLNILKKIYQEAKTPDSKPVLFREVLQEKLKYALTNSINSQGCFMGYWVRKTIPTSNFELLYTEWLDTPYQIIQDYDILDNPLKDLLYTRLINYPDQPWSIDNDFTCEFI